MKIGEAFVHLFLESKARQRPLWDQWIKMSYNLGGRLPDSLMSTSIQRDGDVDMVLRCIEDEIANDQTTLGNPISSPFHYLVMMSNYWVGSMYETLRLLRKRNLLDRNEQSDDLFRAIEVVRITLDKHEIARDRKLTGSQQLVRQPWNPDSAPDPYEYSPGDDKRAHIMPTGLSPRGSVAWQAIDVMTQSDRWVERRWISEGLIELWGQ